MEDLYIMIGLLSRYYIFPTGLNILSYNHNCLNIFVANKLKKIQKYCTFDYLHSNELTDNQRNNMSQKRAVSYIKKRFIEHNSLFRLF